MNLTQAACYASLVSALFAVVPAWAETVFKKQELEAALRASVAKTSGMTDAQAECVMKRLPTVFFGNRQAMTESEFNKRLEIIEPLLIAMMLDCTARRVDLDEFRVDYKNYGHAIIRFSGQAVLLMGNLHVTKGPRDANLVVVDISRLPRDEQLAVHRRCGNVAQPCKLTLTGVASDIAGVIPSLNAMAVVFAK